MRKLDYPDLTESALHFHLCDAENSIVVLAPVSGVYANITQVFETKAFKKFNRQGKLGCSRVDQRLALNFLTMSLRRQVPILPISYFYWNSKYTHASLITDSELRR